MAQAIISSITIAVEAGAIENVLPGRKIRIDMERKRTFYRIDSAHISSRDERSDGRHEAKLVLTFLGSKP